MLDVTCEKYERKVAFWLREARKIMRKISRTSPRDNNMVRLWSEHRRVWDEIDRIIDLYRKYRSCT